MSDANAGSGPKPVPKLKASRARRTRPGDVETGRRPRRPFSTDAAKLLPNAKYLTVNPEPDGGTAEAGLSALATAAKARIAVIGKHWEWVRFSRLARQEHSDLWRQHDELVVCNRVNAHAESDETKVASFERFKTTFPEYNNCPDLESAVQAFKEKLKAVLPTGVGFHHHRL